MGNESMIQLIVHSDSEFLVSTPFYEAFFALRRGQWSLGRKTSNPDAANAEARHVAGFFAHFPIHSCVHSLDGPDVTSDCQVLLVGTKQSKDILHLSFESKGSSLWECKSYEFAFTADSITYSVYVVSEGKRIDDIYYFATDWSTGAVTQWSGGQAGFERYYAPRFDWSTGSIHRQKDQPDSLGCQQWLSPPPFCYAMRHEEQWVSCGVIAEPGCSNFLSFDYVVSPGGEFSLKLDFEGHTLVGTEGFRSPGIRFGFRPASTGNEAVHHYIQSLHKGSDEQQVEERSVVRDQPAWWKEPIFCGWGQQRFDYRRDHNGTENGHFLNVGAYATENKYRAYTALMKQKGIHPGTIIIDYKWAKQDALAEPDPLKWSDMRAFIEEQHELGRKVLLWYCPLLTEGLPIEACMTLQGRAVAADPTSDQYVQVMKEQIRKMLGDEADCMNADGLKIDFTQNIASERGRFRNYLSTSWALLNECDPEHIYPKLGSERSELIQTAGSLWGVELLKAYIHVIYTRLKTVKPDAVLMAHTANPYFAEIVDILRLNDLDGASPDILEIMGNRAAIAQMCNAEWLIDTDNDLMVNKAMWRSYVSQQSRMGIPVTYYLSGIASSNESFEEDDYAHLRRVWAEYRQQLANAD